MSIPEASKLYFSKDNEISFGVGFNTLSFSSEYFKLHIFLCITLTPFGFPVVPEVYIIYAISFGLFCNFILLLFK